MSASGPTVEFEALKFRRAPVVGTVSVLIGVALPVLAAAFMVAATSDGSSQIGLKAAAMLTATGWAGYLAMVGMLLSVGALMGIGFVVCWCFGREFTEKTEACLFALPVSRLRLASAKFTVILLWALLLCLVSLAVAFLAGALIGLGVPGPEDLAVAGKAWCAGALAALLACPLAVVASVARGYLPGVGALVLLVVITQVVTAFGAGAWFPYAAPGLWMGMGGAAAAETVSPLQLFLCVPVSALGIAITAQWWKNMQISSG
ncbi:ABC-2 type transport system permease protein [Arthrobacter sp. SLBN-112]|uniref:ABC transporter permease n=1 Tax=Arthrobacter sp. SLBN-112 TaxID=2768452 RepID=UPI001153CFF4|nr:ABC transporter permease [Arthrobacter sp. SLBN-112]TQJ40073.1 ABC-2 type transport system permease protein [Arthrobacter sp. SLBN-112]